MAWYQNPIPFPKQRATTGRAAGGLGAAGDAAAGEMDHGCDDQRPANQVTWVSLKVLGWAMT